MKTVFHAGFSWSWELQAAGSHVSSSTAPQATVEAQVVVAFWRHSDNSGGDWLIAAGEKYESMIPIPTALCGFNDTFIWNWAILYKNKIQIFSEKWISNYIFFPLILQKTIE